MAARRRLDEVRETAEELTRAELEVAKVRRRLVASMLAANDVEFVRPSAIAEAAGISRQRLHQLLTAERERLAKEAAAKRGGRT